MIWFLLACGGTDVDMHNRLEVGLGVSEFRFAVQKTLSMSCMDTEGTEWLYVHAFSRWNNRDCADDDTVNDEGQVISTHFDASCQGIEDALLQTELTRENIVCGGGRVPNTRTHQAAFWFSGWDEEWPVDSLFSSGSYTTCVGLDPVEGDPARNTQINGASFTPNPYSEELLVAGALHGVLDVDHCGSL